MFCSASAESGRSCWRGLEPVRRLVELALVGEHDPQVHYGLERVGLDPERLPVVIAGLVDPALLVERQPQVGQDPEVVWLDLTAWR